MTELHIVNKNDLQEELLEDILLYEGEIILLVYGEIKKLSKFQKQSLEEIEENIKSVDKLHSGKSNFTTVLKHLNENYEGYSLNSEEKKIILDGSLANEQILPMLTGKTNKKSLFKPKTQSSKDTVKKKKHDTNLIIDCMTTTENEVNTNDSVDEESDNTTKPENHEEKGLETTNTTDTTIKTDIKKSSDTELDLSGIGKINNVSIQALNKGLKKDKSKKKSSNGNKEKENIALRKKYESGIINNDPSIACDEEIIDEEVESRAEFLKQRIIAIRKVIEKIVKRCKAEDYEVSNDIAFTWVITIIQTSDIEQFNNHLRLDINVTPEEYKALSKLALNYYDLCNQIYEVDVNE